MKAKIVKFKDGMFGVRKLTLIGYTFADVRKGEHFWWSSAYKSAERCHCATVEQAIQVIDKYCDNGEVVKR
jgi:hypothetical protein